MKLPPDFHSWRRLVRLVPLLHIVTGNIISSRLQRTFSIFTVGILFCGERWKVKDYFVRQEENPRRTMLCEDSLDDNLTKIQRSTTQENRVVLEAFWNLIFRNLWLGYCLLLHKHQEKTHFFYAFDVMEELQPKKRILEGLGRSCLRQEEKWGNDNSLSIWWRRREDSRRSG